MRQNHLQKKIGQGALFATKKKQPLTVSVKTKNQLIMTEKVI
jgi:hypothetical protein